MNSILEQLHPDKGVVARRQQKGLPPLEASGDAFTAYLHEELRACFLNGHDYAAILTACAVVDAAIKGAIHFDAFVKADCQFDPAVWDRVDAMKFGNAINLAKKQGVISKEEWVVLEWLREHVRNVYLHGQTPHWIKDKEETIVRGDLTTGEVKEETVRVRENIVVQRMVRIVADRNICERVVLLADGCVRAVVARSKAKLEEWRGANPSKPTIAQVQNVLANMQRQGLQGDLLVTSDFPPEFPQRP